MYLVAYHKQKMHALSVDDSGVGKIVLFTSSFYSFHLDHFLIFFRIFSLV